MNYLAYSPTGVSPFNETLLCNVPVVDPATPYLTSTVQREFKFGFTYHGSPLRDLILYLSLVGGTFVGSTPFAHIVFGDSYANGVSDGDAVSVTITNTYDESMIASYDMAGTGKYLATSTYQVTGVSINGISVAASDLVSAVYTPGSALPAVDQTKVTWYMYDPRAGVTTPTSVVYQDTYAYTSAAQGLELWSHFVAGCSFTWQAKMRTFIEYERGIGKNMTTFPDISYSDIFTTVPYYFTLETGATIFMTANGSSITWGGSQSISQRKVVVEGGLPGQSGYKQSTTTYALRFEHLSTGSDVLLDGVLYRNTLSNIQGSQTGNYYSLFGGKLRVSYTTELFSDGLRFWRLTLSDSDSEEVLEDSGDVYKDKISLEYSGLRTKNTYPLTATFMTQKGYIYSQQVNLVVSYTQDAPSEGVLSLENDLSKDAVKLTWPSDMTASPVVSPSSASTSLTYETIKGSNKAAVIPNGVTLNYSNLAGQTLPVGGIKAFAIRAKIKANRFGPIVSVPLSADIRATFYNENYRLVCKITGKNDVDTFLPFWGDDTTKSTIYLTESNSVQDGISVTTDTPETGVGYIWDVNSLQKNWVGTSTGDYYINYENNDATADLCMAILWDASNLGTAPDDYGSIVVKSTRMTGLW